MTLPISRSSLLAGTWRAFCLRVPASVVLVFFIQTGCGGDNVSGNERALARVGSETISESSFVGELERRAGRFSVDFSAPDARLSVIEEMIDERVQLARARDLGLDQAPDIKRELDAVLMRHLRERELVPVIAEVTVTEDDVTSYFADHEEEFSRPERLRAAIVQLEVAPNASDAVRLRRRAEAEALHEEALLMSDGFHGFGPIAARASGHRASRYKGGDIGWLVRDEDRYPFDSAALEAIFALKSVGDIGPIVDGVDGLYLVRLIAVEPRSTPPLARVAPMIQQRLFDEKQKRVRRDWISILRSRAGVEYDPKRLAEIELPAKLVVSEPKASSAPPSLPGS